MKIYIAHSRNFNFQKELYEPIKKSLLIKEHTFFFPHDLNSEPFNSRKLFQNGCNLIIAEVSYPSTGLGIELGWADILKIPILCIYKNGSQISESIRSINATMLEYSDSKDLIDTITDHIGGR